MADVISVSVKLEKKLYDELKEAIDFFSKVPMMNPTNGEIALNPSKTDFMYIVPDTNISNFLKGGAIRLIEQYRDPEAKKYFQGLITYSEDVRRQLTQRHNQ